LRGVRHIEIIKNVREPFVVEITCSEVNCQKSSCGHYGLQLLQLGLV